MINLQINDKRGIFLDHRQLINASYSKGLATNSNIYELLPGLFEFRIKMEVTKERQATKSHRKRKYYKEPAVPECMAHLQKYLTVLHAKFNFSVFEVALPIMSRYWEEAYSLPQLNGANNTNVIQKFHVSANTTYIIPAGSRFYNLDVQQLPTLLPELSVYDIIIMDPPWKNKYIRRLKRAKPELGYNTLNFVQLSNLPIAQLTHKRTLIAIWCTNAEQHQRALLEGCLPRWHLRLLHSVRWYKLNTAGSLICEIHANETQKKQPFEMLYLGIHEDAPQPIVESYKQSVANVEVLLSVPSIVHSHKPPLLPWLREILSVAEGDTNLKGLEIFARYLQPDCTSVGLEVLKLMDSRLYELRRS